jgi:hypothetical protein
MLDLVVASELARRRVGAAFEPEKPPRRKRERTRLMPVRSTSASALRRLADRLEPSLGA